MRLSPSVFPLLLAGIAAIFGGCAKPAADAITPGQTTVTALKQQRGTPLRVVTPASRPQAQLLDYPDGTSYQAERKIVVAIASAPLSPEERTLQYWRHKWKGKPQRFEEIADSAVIHGRKSYQLVSPQDGMAVVYDPNADRVVRVVRYGAR